LLAAGASRRFGTSKLRAPLADGTPLGLASARPLTAALAEVTVVVRPDDRELIQMYRDAGLRVCPCPQAARGLGASLACGVAATAEADAWLIALADMPYIKTSTVATVVAALARGALLAAPEHAGQRGHPVGLARVWRDALLALDDDHGARPLLAAHAGQLTRLAVDDPGVLRDIDTPADLAAARSTS
jgi:molybdenum cofactor cytidylyltransferase